MVKILIVKILAVVAGLLLPVACNESPSERTAVKAKDGQGTSEATSGDGPGLNDGSGPDRSAGDGQRVGDHGTSNPDGFVLKPDSRVPTPSFRFISWADTKSGTSVLSALSNQAVPLDPAFTIYPGDMVSSWSSSLMNTWRNAMDGGKSNGMFQITFTVRGNHDASGSSSGYGSWMAANHSLATAAQAIGARNYTDMPGKNNQVYSFDYGNAHLVGLDSTGDADTIGSDQISWLDSDLAAAESRGLNHAFIFFHGPIYCLAEHCSCTTGICKSGIYKLVTVLNKHPMVSATFHGHEHVNAYTYLDSKRDAKITHPFHQFVTGDAGAGPDVCDNGRYDYWMNSHGFLVVDVAGKKVKASFYKQGNTTAQKTISWTH